jgi:hypothetical protein
LAWVVTACGSAAAGVRSSLLAMMEAILRAGQRVIAVRRADRFATHDTLNAHLSHQSGDRAAGDIVSFAAQLAPDLMDTIDLKVLVEHASDQRLELAIATRSQRCFRRIGPPCGMGVIGRRCDRQQLADRLDLRHALAHRLLRRWIGCPSQPIPWTWR